MPDERHLETTTREHEIKVLLSDEERDLLQAFADEQDIDDLSEALRAMIHELVALHDQVWDAQFAHSTEPLDKKAKQALEADRAGLTKDLDL